jgi:CheY-like chemotaxis protein
LGRQLRILVVDNEPRITEVLGEMLGEGREIRILNDAVEAARLLDTETFDVLVTDFVMPGLDGGRLSEIAWDRCGAHCIVLTGNDPGQVRRGGAVASVHRKPPKWRLLLDELRELERSLDG